MSEEKAVPTGSEEQENSAPTTNENQDTVPAAEAAPAQEPKPEEPVAEAVPAQEPKAEEPAAEAVPTQEPKAEEPAAEAAPAQEPKPEEPAAEAAPAQEPKPEEPAAEAAPAQEPKPEEPAAEAAPAQPTPEVAPVVATQAAVDTSSATPDAAPDAAAIAASISGAGSEKFAGFWIRFIALIIDGLLISGVCFGIQVATGIQMVEASYVNGMASQNFSGFGLLVIILYYTITTGSAMQGTVGKRILGLYVRKKDGGRVTFLRALGRYFATCLSTLTLMIGFIMAGFTKEKTALHDLVAGTRVVKGKPKK